MTAPTLKLGNVEVGPLETKSELLTMLLWGMTACGKTTLAATAPKPILWVNFDQSGPASIQNKDGIILADFHGQKPEVVKEFTKDEPGGYIERLVNHALDSKAKTIVVDSLTSYQHLSLLQGVSDTSHMKSTMILPGQAGYGARNRYVLLFARALARSAQRAKLNLILICHEDEPTKDKDGIVTGITMNLGGALKNEVPLNISEVWNMYDMSKQRTVSFRPERMRFPCRTRMFKTGATDPSNFTWIYDPATDTGMKISDMFDAWVANGYKKIDAPK